MAGLFDLEDPKNVGLLMAVASLVGGAPGGRKNFGADVGNAMQNGLLGYGSARQQQAKLAEEEQQKQMRAMQLSQMQRQNDQQGRIDALGPQFMRPGMPQMQPTDQETPSGPAGPGKMDWAGYSNAMTGIDPQRGLALQAQLAEMNKKNLQKVGPGESLYDVGAGKSVFSAPDKPHFVDAGDYVIPVNPQTGQPVGPAIKKGMTAGEKATDSRARERLAYDQSQGSKPHLYDGPTGPMWVTPPKAGAPGPTQPVPGPDGQPIQAKKRDQPLTEAQGNATAYAMRAEQSDGLLKDLEAKGHNPAAFPGIRNRAAGGPLNVLSTDQAQQYNAAKQNFVTAVLRKESGAAISQSEFDKEDQKYFPQPGDGKAVRAQKEKARALAIESLKVQAGPAGQAQLGKQHASGWSIKPL